MRSPHVLPTALVLLLLAVAPPSSAAVFWVVDTADAPDANPGDGVCAAAFGRCTLRAAVEEAGAWAGSDLVLLPPTHYVLTGPITYIGYSDDLAIRGGGRDTTVVDANGASRAFVVGGGGIVSIEGVSIVGSTIAGIWTSYTQFRLSNARVSDTLGMGVDCDTGSRDELLDVEVVRNGEGVRVVGGGPSSSVLIEDSLIAENQGRGLRLTSDSSSAIVRRSEIRDNLGGGIESHAASSVRLEESTVANNSAVDGGGVFVGSCSALHSTNSTISGNSATRHGGGIFRDPWSLCHGTELINTTVSNNTADSDNDGVGDGGGVMDQDDPDGGGIEEFRLANTLIAGNHDLSGEVPDCSSVSLTSYGPRLTSYGYNLIGDSTGCSLAGDTSTDLFDFDPLLGPLAANGGPTRTHALQALVATSPAINAVPLAACTTLAGEPSDRDQRGVARPQGAACDIGAFEVVATACLDGVDNDGDGYCDTATATCVDGSIPGDRQCFAAVVPQELPVCADGKDNDKDGLTDYPADPQCTSATDQSESFGCGFGPELLVVLPLLGWARVRRVRRSASAWRVG